MELFKIGQQEKLAQRIAGANHEAAGLKGTHTVQLVLSGSNKADGLVRIAVQHAAFTGEGNTTAGAGK